MPDSLPSWTQAGHYGSDSSGVMFAEAKIAAAWNVQGNLERPKLREEVRRLFDIDLPAANAVATYKALTALWLGPTSWLLVAGGTSPLDDFAAKRDALNALGGALFDLSASRVAWTVSGPYAATVLAKGCPLDFHRRAFAARSCAQSLLGHINALFVRADDDETFVVLVARSFARDAWHALTEAAAQYGYDVGPPVPYR